MNRWDDSDPASRREHVSRRLQPQPVLLPVRLRDFPGGFPSSPVSASLLRAFAKPECRSTWQPLQQHPLRQLPLSTSRRLVENSRAYPGLLSVCARAPESCRIEFPKHARARRRYAPDPVGSATVRVRLWRCESDRSLLFPTATSPSCPTIFLLSRQYAVRFLLNAPSTFRLLRVAVPAARFRAE